MNIKAEKVPSRGTEITTNEKDSLFEVSENCRGRRTHRLKGSEATHKEMSVFAKITSDFEIE